MTLLGRLLFLASATSLFAAAQTLPPAEKTIWDGVFTLTQAERGYQAYGMYCSRCHGDDLSGRGGVLIGGKFMDRWREDHLTSFYTVVHNTMPPGARGRVSDANYLDIVAYVLHVNEFPAGQVELTAASLDHIAVVGRDGPKAVPDFALVTISGCLAQDADQQWMVTNASEPIRTRNPRESTEPEIAAAQSRAAGTHTFHFLDSREFSAELKAGRWMEAKGFLMRAPGNDRVNLTWLKGLRESCVPQSNRPPSP